MGRNLRNPDAPGGSPRPIGAVGCVLALGLLACLAVGLGLVGWRIVGMRRYYGRVDETRAKIESLRRRRPADVPQQQWERAVDWTSNVICQIYFSPEHGDLESLQRLCEALDEKLAQEVDLETLQWAWDQCELAKGRGSATAIEFRDVRLLTKPPITDDSLPGLWSLKKCLGLDLSGTQVTDAGMVHLSGLDNLTSLDVSNTQVSDAGLELVANSNLLDLNLSRTSVTDAGMAHLASLSKLRSLWLTDTAVGDEGLRHLEGLQAMDILGLEGTRVTDEGIRYLLKMRALRQLDLGRTQITDEGVSRLATMPGLSHLSLDGTSVTDAGVLELTKSPSLDSLSVVDTAVSAEGAEKLRQRLPVVTIRRE